MAVATARLTADEYFALDLPERHQLVNGEIVVNEPGFRHQRIVLEIVSALREWTRAEPGRAVRPVTARRGRRATARRRPCGSSRRSAR